MNNIEKEIEIIFIELKKHIYDYLDSCNGNIMLSTVTSILFLLVFHNQEQIEANRERISEVYDMITKQIEEYNTEISQIENKEFKGLLN
jgi:hypothetical protein